MESPEGDEKKEKHLGVNCQVVGRVMKRLDLFQRHFPGDEIEKEEKQQVFQGQKRQVKPDRRLSRGFSVFCRLFPPGLKQNQPGRSSRRNPCAAAVRYTGQPEKW